MQDSYNTPHVAGICWHLELSKPFPTLPLIQAWLKYLGNFHFASLTLARQVPKWASISCSEGNKKICLSHEEEHSREFWTQTNISRAYYGSWRNRGKRSGVPREGLQAEGAQPLLPVLGCHLGQPWGIRARSPVTFPLTPSSMGGCILTISSCPVTSSSRPLKPALINQPRECKNNW